VRTTELTRSHRRRLTRHAHKLARSGRYDGHAAIIAEIRQHQDFHAPTHEDQLLLSQLDLLCSYARKRHRLIDCFQLLAGHEEVGEGRGYDGLATPQAQPC
jgi:hypothetical protein